jgi:membrane-bound ClpP family serine protease
MFEFLGDPMIAGLFLVFGLVALVLSLINFLEALNY